jgi:hypothetical protein
MTRDQAERERERLSKEHPEATWLTREEADATWSVVRVNLAQPQSNELSPETRADERPPQPDDTRSGHIRRVGGNIA